VEDQALHILGEVDACDLGLCAFDADGTDEQAHMRLILRKDMLDPCTYFGFDPIGGAPLLGEAQDRLNELDP
jgi:hypothetical protein